MKYLLSLSKQDERAANSSGTAGLVPTVDEVLPWDAHIRALMADAPDRIFLLTCAGCF
jgi:hypothetical protein